MNVKKVIVRATVAVAGLLAVLVGVTLASTKVESTSSGVHTRLFVPLLGMGTAKVGVFAGTGDQALLKGFLDGPVVRVGAGGAWKAKWFCEDRVHEQSGKQPALSVDCGGRRSTFHIGATAVAEPGITGMPERLLVLSDIEGNLAYLDGALNKLGIVDATGAWTWGNGRLVIAGDSVDRGRDVFAVLWRLHGLSVEAKQAGGRVDVLIGNHEQYILRGNVSRAHPEHIYALGQLGGVGAAFGADTVIGAWLRTQPVIVQAGDVLITHGGISPAVAKRGLSVDQLNAAIASYWRGAPGDTAALDSVFGVDGLTQYRGYLQDLPEQYPQATAGDVDAALRAFNARTIVVGHSIVEKVSALYDNKVYAVDVNSNTAAPEALLFTKGVPSIVDTGTPRRLPVDNMRGPLRRLDLLAGGDWHTLARVVQSSRELARLPHPY